MPRFVPSRDVLKPNARISHAFDGRIVGHFRRKGPNAWDDYVYEPGIEGTVALLPGLRVQVEAEGPQVRLRHHGRVVVVEWQYAENESTSAPATAERRRRFLEAHVGGFENAPGLGAAAVIARNLRC
jgi:hypothetical protein